MHGIRMQLCIESVFLHSLTETVTVMLKLDGLLPRLIFKVILLQRLSLSVHYIFNISLPFIDGFLSNLSLINQSKAPQAPLAQRVPGDPRVKMAEMEEM